MVETVAGLDRFLLHAHGLVSDDGRILCDSVEVGTSDDPGHMAYSEANRRSGRYIGEMRLQFEFQGVKGPFCGWLHIDSLTLKKHAESAQWTCEVVCREESGDYLAQLTKLT